MKLKTRFLLMMIVIFVGFMLITWFLSVQLINEVNQQWGKQFVEQQVMFHKHRTLSPLIREIALARQMAAEPAIIDMALHEHDPEFRRRGIAVMEKYRSNFRDHSYFAAFAQSGNYYFNDAANQYVGNQLRYVLSPTAVKDKWFYATMAAGKEYQVNIDHNVHLNVTKAWINVLIRSGNKTVGIIGTGIDLSDLIKETVNITQPGVDNLFIDKSMAIQLHSDPKLIDYMTVAKDVGQRIKVDVLLKNPADINHLRQLMLELKSLPAEIATLWVTYEGERHLLGVAYLPEIGWYNLTLMDVHSLDFFDGMFIGPLLFGLALLLALLIVGWALRSWILNPITALRTSTDKIGHGDFEIGPPIRGAGEIAHLSQAFTRMAEVVRNSNLELEEKVHERTTALTEEITERKHAETELLRFRNVLDNTLDMIFMFESESLRFVYVNQGAVLNLGYSQEELLGMTFYRIKPLVPGVKFRELIVPLLSGKQSLLRFETVHRRKDGTDFTVNILLQLVMQSDGSGLFVAIVRDITERKLVQDEILRINANLEEQVLQRTELLTKEITERRSLEIELIRSSEEQRRVIGCELHDGLGQHLISLSLLCASLQQQLTNRAQPEANTAQRIAELINEATAMTRSVASGLYPVALEYGLAAALEELVNNARSLHKMSYILVVPPEVQVHDPLVAINLYRITQEVITNALKYSQASLMRIDLARVDGKVRLTLSDNGIGIDPARLGSAKGLGMHSMHYRASLLGGSMEIESNPQQGTTITVTYPDLESQSE